MKEVKIIFKINDSGEIATVIQKTGFKNTVEDKFILLGLLENLKLLESGNIKLAVKQTRNRNAEE